MNLENLILADTKNLHRIGLKKILKKQFKNTEIKEVDSKSDLFYYMKTVKVNYLFIDPNNIPYFDSTDLSILKYENPKCKIIIISYCENNPNLNELIKSGINGFVCKNCQEQVVYDAILKIESGQRYWCPNSINIILDSTIAATMQSDILTPREIEILKQIADGNSGKNIASNLFISLHTYRTHKKNIMKKTATHSVSELMLYTIENKII